MSNFLNMMREGLKRIQKVWIIAAIVILALVFGVAGIASGTIGRVIAAFGGNPPAAPVALQAIATPTMAPMAGMAETPTAIPNKVIPTTAPANGQPTASTEMDALLMQMQQTMQSLNGMMGQLEQQSGSTGKSPAATPTAVSRKVDLTPMMAELQDINRNLLPLMQRIQADLKGNPSAEEMASVRAQVAQIQTRMTNLMNQLVAARNGAAYVPPATIATALPGMGTMPGMGAMQPTAVAQPNNQTTNPSQMAMSQLDGLMQQMQVMLQQMQTQQMGNKTGQTGAMNMAATPTAMLGMSNPSNPAMSDMMSMMDNMMSMMSGMMGGSGSSSGMNMATATPAPMGSMSNPPAQSGMMDNMMKMMDNMMMMMDNMMQMDMMGMPDM